VALLSEVRHSSTTLRQELNACRRRRRPKS
jgi:hypothetical protein